MEKPGLLPPRPDTEGLEEETRNGPGRRPADVWVGNWGVHGPAAFDLAVTSGMLQAVLPHTVSSGSHVALEYEARKRQYQDTQVQYPAQGLQFIPFVAKAFGGGWGPSAMQTWRSLAGLLAARSSETPDLECQRLLQLLSVALQVENFSAVLRHL